jgi:hypothetical protein
MSPQKMEQFVRLRNGCADVPKLKPILDVPTRWNSTHAMIDTAIKLRTPLGMMMSADNDLQALWPRDSQWYYLERIKTLLEVSQCISFIIDSTMWMLKKNFFKDFVDATQFISGEEYPTINVVIPAYNFLMDSLDNFIEQEGDNESPLKRAAQLSFNKLRDYYIRTDDSPISMVSFCKYFLF